MKEILPGVHAWSWFSEKKGLDFNGLYIRSGQEAVVVDPPPFAGETARLMERLGAPRAVLLTNRDHARASAELAARFGIPIRIHEKDAPLVSVPLGTPFKDGEILEAGLRAVHVPDAKSPGETAFHFADARALIVGDAVIGRPAGALSLLPAEMFADAARARAGIRRLLDRPFEALLVGDGQSILEGGRAALETFLSR